MKPILSDDERAPLTRLVLETHLGQVTVERFRDRVVSKGLFTATATISLPTITSITSVRRGIAGAVGDRTVMIVRPRFGLRRADRSIEVRMDQEAWCIVYFSSRHFQVRRAGSDDIVYEQRGRRRLLDDGLGREQTSLALAIVESGVVETSSLLNFLTTL